MSNLSGELSGWQLANGRELVAQWGTMGFINRQRQTDKQLLSGYTTS